MKNQNREELLSAIENSFNKKDKRKRKNMVVSGAQVKKLQMIIKKKNEK